MATVNVVLRTCGIIVFTTVCLQFCAARRTPPAISSFTVTDELYNNNSTGQNGGDSFRKYVLQLQGVGFFGNMQWALTPKSEVYGSQCESDVGIVGSAVREVETTPDKCVLEVTVPVTRENVFFCLLFDGKWIHQGKLLTVNPSEDQFSQAQGEDTTKTYASRDELLQSQESSDFQFPSAEYEDQVFRAQETDGQREFAESSGSEVEQSTVDGADREMEDEQSVTPSDDVNSLVYVQREQSPGVLFNYRENTVKGQLRLEESPLFESKMLSSYDSVLNEEDEDININKDNVLKMDPQNLQREPFVVDISDDLDSNNKVHLDDREKEYLSKDSDRFDGNLDEIDVKHHIPVSKKWIDLTHDIDVNYDENGVYRPADSVENVPRDRLKYLTEVTQTSQPKNDVDVDFVSINDDQKKSEKVQSQNVDQNTWNFFKGVSSDRTIPKHWIDLSHDIDVNYPKVDSGVVLDVEGVDVEKNIFDSKDFEDIEMDATTGYAEFDGYAEEASQQSKTKELIDSLETLDKRNEINSELDVQQSQNRDYEQREALFKRRKRDITAENAVQQSSTSVKPKESTSETAAPVLQEVKQDPRNQNSLTRDGPSMAGASVVIDARNERLNIEALRVERADKDPTFSEDGIPELLEGTEAVLRIFGTGITEDTIITFTHQPNAYGGPCQFPVTGSFQIEAGTVSANSAKVTVSLPKGTGESFYMCAKRPSDLREGYDSQTLPFVHQGSEVWLQLHSYSTLLPLWATLIIITTCLMFSALFSGLNLGLLSLDRTELKILCNTGSDKEKEYARVIQPVRDHGNYLLCSILLGNVAVNSTFTILLDSLTSGLFAVIFSTITIVLLGEITPQAICSRHGLAVGAKTIHVTKAVMAITFPLSYPVSKLLDFLLGEEIGNVYNRERLKELVKVTNDINDLDKDEVNIISGALEMRKKTVLEIMTKIEDVFMLDYEAVLDFETVSEIMKSGFSRIPVFEGKRTSIVAMLYVKDLAFVDPDDNTPLKTLCQFYQNPCNFVFEDVTLDVIFRQFKEGHKGHLAFVQRVNSEGEGDPFYETIGLVTLEDVIEELIQAEIMDETDVFTDNKSKRRRHCPPNKLQDFGVFAERRENQRIRISPQLTLATFQYLSTSVDAFKPDVVSETILRRMLKQDIIHHIKYRNKERQKSDPATLIYEQGKPVDYFVLVLEGRVEVIVGRESLVFESGPFTYFGCQALMQNVCIGELLAAESPVVPPTALGSLQSINMDAMMRYSFVPDYSVRAITEVFYVSIKRSLYLAAKRATLMERCAGGGRQKASDEAGEQFDDEVEKLLHSLEEEGSPTTNRSPSHHLNSHPVSPSGPNGSIRNSRHQSPTKTLAQLAEPEYMDSLTNDENNTLLPHSKS